ncbi:MAG: hypothetical protein ABSG96_18560 [Terracidiphilus sp.]|jgi:hypothetical protein
MSEPTPFGLSQRFSQLVGRKVTFVQTTLTIDNKIKQLYGIYTVLPQDSAIVVKAELPLMGSFAGALVGFPDNVVKEHLKVTPIEELLRDAIFEVFNIASAAITTEGRAVFTKMVADTAYIDGAAGAVFKKPGHRSCFNVSIDGYQGGKFNIFAPLSVSSPQRNIFKSPI